MVCAVTLYQTPTTQSIERPPPGVEPDARIVRVHPRRDVARNRHVHLIARVRLGEIGDGMVSKIVKAQTVQRSLDLAKARSA